MINKFGWLLIFKITCFWFFWAAILPFLAMASAASSKIEGSKSFKESQYFVKIVEWKKNKLFKNFIGALFLSLSLLTFFASYIGYKSVSNFQKVSYENILNFIRTYELEKKDCSEYYSDFRMGGVFLVNFLDSYSDFYLSKLEKQEKESDMVFEMINCIADKLILSNSAKNSLLTSSLQVEAKRLLYEKNVYGEKIDLEKFKYDNYDRWFKKTLLLENKMPRREDLLAPFLSFALETNNTKDAVSICSLRTRTKIASLCNLINAYYILEKENISKTQLNESIGLIKKAINQGILSEKVYGWWIVLNVEAHQDDYEVGGYSKEGIPISADIIFQVSNEEAQKLINLIEKF